MTKLSKVIAAFLPSPPDFLVGKLNIRWRLSEFDESSPNEVLKIETCVTSNLSLISAKSNLNN